MFRVKKQKPTKNDDVGDELIDFLQFSDGKLNISFHITINILIHLS